MGFERELAAVRACLSLQGDGSDERGRSKYEERLRLQKQMLDTVNVGISMVSVEGIILEVNQFWEQLTGWKPNEMIGRHVSELTSTDASLIRDEFRDVVASDQAKVRHPVKHRDGHVVWVEIATQMVVRDGVPLMYAVTTDISSKVDAEQRAKKAESALAQAQKMDALGRLTGGIAHDFNNLLAVIMTHAYFLQEELVEQDPRYQDVAEIAAAGERAAALTKQLLAFSRNQRLQLSSVDVNGVIHNLARMLQRLIGEEMRLEIKTSDVGATHADGSQLEQVIMNLVVNARDAMPKGGAVSVETSRVVTVVGDEVGAGEWVCLAVRDEGCGMGEETKRRLFEPFFTTKEKGKGTGLGLSTSYGIVKQFGGHILVDSEMGRGTVMRVLLPLVRNEILEAPARSSAAIGKRGTETVLLVEDDRAVRAALVRVLEERGYDVVAAG
ncbi:MAG TPA: ATP-binding protein, partial [Kofleriaceae bacterium]